MKHLILEKIVAISITVAIAGSLISGTGCDIIAAYDTTVPPDYEYLCTAQIYRELNDETEFTENWEARIFPSDDEKIEDLCRTKLDDYMKDSMAPLPILWKDRELELTTISLRKGAFDCDSVLTAPKTYGAPVGSEISWNSPDTSRALVTLWIQDGDNMIQVQPAVESATLHFATRHGYYDPDTETYEPLIHHIRVSDFFMELEPFAVDIEGSVKVSNFYIQSIGTLSTENLTGTRIFPISSDPGKTKFFWSAKLTIDGDTQTINSCFQNPSSNTAVNYRTGTSKELSFAINMSDFAGEGPLKGLNFSISSPVGTAFDQHQPVVDLLDRETPETDVRLSVVIGNISIPDEVDGKVFDDDNDITRIIWFEDFEGEEEEVLGNGQAIDGTFTPGVHQITAVVYDENGAYNSDTMTLTVYAPPVAVNDAYTTPEDIDLAVVPGVLVNDTGTGPLTAVKNTDPLNGILTLKPTGAFTYKPNANFNGSDTFTYHANDGNQDSNIATVSIIITPVNDKPVASDDTYSTDEDTSLNRPAPGVLANDTDIEDDSLTAVLNTKPENGTLTLNNDGSFDYTPIANYYGEDSFTYKANDGEFDSDPATVTINVVDLPPKEQIPPIVPGPTLPLNPGQANSLQSILDAAKAQLVMGSTKSACNLFGAFINHLQSFVDEGILSQEQAQPLFDQVNNVRAEIECK